VAEDLQNFLNVRSDRTTAVVIFRLLGRVCTIVVGHALNATAFFEEFREIGFELFPCPLPG